MEISWKNFLVSSFIRVTFSFFQMIPTKHIVVKGNISLTDEDVIHLADYQNYPYLYRQSKKTIQDKLLASPYIDEVKISRKLWGEISFEIKEAKPLFYNRENNRLILSNQKQIETKDINGVPILTNYVPDSLYNRLCQGLSKIDMDVIHLISEIIYDPWKNGETVIDETRFFLRMNDGNSVYVNLIHLDKLNSYIEIYATLEDKKGILYLDSSSDKISFSLY